MNEIIDQSWVLTAVRYRLGEWFNLVEGQHRYMDSNSIRATSQACESWLVVSIILQKKQNGWFHQLFRTKPSIPTTV